eukprot:359726-Chlamydomonas_euryale.AAC.2
MDNLTQVSQTCPCPTAQDHLPASGPAGPSLGPPACLRACWSLPGTARLPLSLLVPPWDRPPACGPAGSSLGPPACR